MRDVYGLGSAQLAHRGGCCHMSDSSSDQPTPGGPVEPPSVGARVREWAAKLGELVDALLPTPQPPPVLVPVPVRGRRRRIRR